jgi:alcohol/geraniol dehydrogenase (NADP+)
MTKIQAWASRGSREKLVRMEFDLGELKPEEAEVAVEFCGVCHSDLSVINNDWGVTKYPCIPGHEIVGKVVALGEQTKGLKIGQRVGIGWNSECCMHCRQCIAGDQQFCPDIRPTILNHFGGYADRVRAQWPWVFPLPDQLDPRTTGPLMCGGITVFHPLIIHQIKPTDRVGIIGMGGLGHMAIKFARAWGCEVTVFTHSESKFDEAKKFGAHRVVSTGDQNAIRAMERQFDLLLVTVNVPLDWPAFIATVAPKGHLHFVGAVEDPVSISVLRDLISWQRSISGSPTGSPSQIALMLDFAARQGVAPQVEFFPMDQVNEALDYLKAGKPRYRLVLQAS